MKSFVSKTSWHCLNMEMENKKTALHVHMVMVQCSECYCLVCWSIRDKLQSLLFLQELEWEEELMHVSGQNTNHNQGKYFAGSNSRMTLCKASVITERNFSPCEYYFPVLFTSVLAAAPGDWKQNYVALWRDPILMTFLASILQNQQTWITGIIQLWRALELLVAYWHPQPLGIYSTLVRKAVPALSAGVHWSSLLPVGSGRHHSPPAPAGPDAANDRARQAAGQLRARQPALPPRQLPGGLQRMQIPHWWGPGFKVHGVWCRLG